MLLPCAVRDRAGLSLRSGCAQRRWSLRAGDELATVI